MGRAADLENVASETRISDMVEILDGAQTELGEMKNEMKRFAVSIQEIAGDLKALQETSTSNQDHVAWPFYSDVTDSEDLTTGK